MISFPQIESWSCNGTESVNSDLVLCPHIEQYINIYIQNYIHFQFESHFVKTWLDSNKTYQHNKTIQKCGKKIANSKDLFSILVTNFF